MSKYKNFILSLFALAFVYSCGGGVVEGEPKPWKNGDGPVAAESAYCDAINQGDQPYEKFLCMGSEVKRIPDLTADKNKWGDGDLGWCPPQSKYGHYFVLVDSTEGYEEEQFALLINQMLAKQNLEIIGPYDKLSIIKIAGQDEQAVELDPIFAQCKPRSGTNSSMYSIDRYVDRSSNKRAMEQTYNNYLTQVTEAGSQFSDLGETTGTFSQIFEQIKELGRKKTLDFGSNYAYRKIIIFSDLMQHSKTTSLIKDCTGKKKCPSYEEYKKTFANEKDWENLMPKFGINKPDVFVYYLQCRHDQDLNIGLLEIWEQYFEENGMNMSYDVESSCEDIFKKADQT